jgi:hypothetical protein
MAEDGGSDIGRELDTLDAELKRLEAEYNMYFAGRLPRPPWETRKRVTALIKRLDRTKPNNYGDRFRFTTLQARFSSFVDLWDRGLRAREEGRAGPFAQARPVDPAKGPKPDDRVMGVTRLTDPAREGDKLQDLYQRVAEARKAAGQEPVPFEKFSNLIRSQMAALRKEGSDDVAFRVAIKNGKVAFSARVVKPKKGDQGEGGS